MFGGRAYLALIDFCLPLADGRAHVAHSGSGSSIVCFVSFPCVEEFCALREFKSHTDRSGHRYVTVRGHNCASLLSNRLQQI